MPKTTHLPGAGDVTIELPALDGDGPAQELILTCSASALFAACREPGGFQPATDGADCVVNRVLGCDIDTMAKVIRWGVGAGSNADPQLPAKIYAAGVLNLRWPLARFLGNLGRGGKPFVAEGADDPQSAGATA